MPCGREWRATVPGKLAITQKPASEGGRAQRPLALYGLIGLSMLSLVLNLMFLETHREEFLLPSAIPGVTLPAATHATL